MNNRSHSDTVNARQRLSFMHRAYIRLQLKSKMLVHVGDVWEQREGLEHDDIVAMLATVRTRASLEMAISRCLGDVPGRTDLLVDSHITQLFGAGMVREVHSLCASFDAIWGPTTDWPRDANAAPVPYIPSLTLLERFVFLFRGRL